MSGSGSGSNDGVFGALVDFEFTRYATPKLVKILYILTFVVIVIGGLFFLVSAFATGEPLAMIVALIVTPIIVLLYLIYARVGLELLSVVFRIGEDVRSIRSPGSAGGGPFGPGSQGPPPGGGPAGGPYGGPPPAGPMAPPSGPPVGGAPSGSWPS